MECSDNGELWVKSVLYWNAMENKKLKIHIDNSIGNTMFEINFGKNPDAKQIAKFAARSPHIYLTRGRAALLF